MGSSSSLRRTQRGRTHEACATRYVEHAVRAVDHRRAVRAVDHRNGGPARRCCWRWADGPRSARPQAARPPVRRRHPPTAARGEAGATRLLWAAIRATAHRVALPGSRKQRQGERSMSRDVPTVVAYVLTFNTNTFVRPALQGLSDADLLKRPSASSSDLFGHDRMRLTLTTIVGIDPRFEFRGTQQPVWF